MPSFFEYLRNIVYYLMFATMVGIFAPAGKYRKFVSLVMGFVLLLIIIQPFAGFIRGGEVPVTQWFAEAFSGGAGENNGAFQAGAEAAYSLWWDEHLRGTFEAQLEAQLSRQLNANGFTLHEARFEYSADFSQITRVFASVSTGSEDTSADTARVPFIRIQPPQIGPIRIGEPRPVEETPACPHTEAVKNLISQFYNLPVTHIYVKVY